MLLSLFVSLSLAVCAGSGVHIAAFKVEAILHLIRAGLNILLSFCLFLFDKSIHLKPFINT